MFHLRAFRTREGYRVTNGPIEITLDRDFHITTSNTSDTVVKDHARMLAKAKRTGEALEEVSPYAPTLPPVV